MPRPTAPLAALLAFAVLAAGPAAAESFATFTIPGSSEVVPVKINNVGTIAGYFYASGKNHGFVRDAAGQVTTFDVDGRDTTPTSLADDGTIVGYYRDAEDQLRGFQRSPGGTITPLVIADSGFSVPHGINNSGTVAGFYRMMENPANLGFIAGLGSELITITPPVPATGSVVNALNDVGVSAGYFAYGLKNVGFVRAPDGNITPFEARTEPVDPRFTPQTEPEAINDAGTIAGGFNYLVCSWGCKAVGRKAFVRTADGTVTLYNVGGNRAYTSVTAINNLGQVTGAFQPARDPKRGYVRDPDGAVVTFEVPDMTFTDPKSINDQGVVVGQSKRNSNAFGFIRTP